MDVLNLVIEGIIGFFRNPPFLLGFIAVAGLALQGKSIDQVLKGGFLAAFGMFIIGFGVDVLVGSILPLNILYQGLYSSTDAAPGLGVAAYTEAYGSVVGLAMLAGFVLHLSIARFTKIKTIFLTGHFLWWMPFIFVAVAVGAGFTNELAIIIWGGVLSALYWSFMPYFLRPFVRDVIGDDSFTLGHPSGFLALVAGTVARYVGDKSKSTEDLKIPKSLGFFREVSITGSIVIFISFVISGLLIGSFNDQNLVTYSLTQGLQFGVGLIILLQGVRMLINEIVPAFEGISAKLIPNAQPAYDCPLLFTYKPNALLIGFVVAMVVSTALIIVSNATNLFGVFLIPLIITSFFECGTAAIIAEGQGGLRGAVVGTAVAAAAMVLVLGLSLSVFQPTIQDWMLIFGGNDMSLWGVVTNLFAGLLSGIL
jgi:PTS system ascorbate-specific IIC component